MRLRLLLGSLVLIGCSSSSTNDQAGSGGSAGGGTGGSAGVLGIGGAVSDIGCNDVSAMKCCSTSKISLSWSAANNHCNGLGMQLVKVESGEENLAVADALSPMNVWIGLTDSNQEGTFQWSDASPLGSYAPWATAVGEPHSPGTFGGMQDCVFVNSAHVWFDHQCAGTLPTVKGFCCE